MKSNNSKFSISIVTPVYNNADTLRESIESVLAQTYNNIEYIIVNDGSTDGSQDILKDYEHRALIINQDNMGQSSALNEGWSRASGEYLGYLSADDVMYPHCIETLVSHLKSGSVLYYSDYDLIDVKSNFIRRVITPNYKISDLLCKLTCQPGLGTLFRADVFRKIGGWNPEYRFIPDFEYWARVSQFGEFERVPYVLGGFRIHNKSGSIKSVDKSLSDEIIFFSDKYAFYPSLECKKKAMFNSRLMSARSHFQSYRFSLGLARYISALKMSPLSALKVKNIFFVLKGGLRKLFYQFRRH